MRDPVLRACGGQNKGVLELKILVTGNMGYIGPSVVKQLRASFPKADIIGLDAGFFAHALTNTPYLPEMRVDQQWFMDIRDVSKDQLKGVDAIVNLAAISNDIMGKIDEKLTLAINYEAGVRLAKLAKESGVKSFVFASSCSVYGFAEEGAKTEKSQVNPLTAYARSKILTEQGLAPLAGDTFTITCFRFATACGMSERLRLDLVLNDFVACALTSKKITVLSDGTPWRPLIHIRDMARAIDWGIQRSVTAGGPFLIVNAGSDEWNIQVKGLAEAVTRAIPGTEVSINLEAPPDKRSYRVDFSLFKKLAPQNQPQVELTQAIHELKEGLESMGFDTADFRDSNFMRIKVLTGLRDRGFLSPDLYWTNRS